MAGILHYFDIIKWLLINLHHRTVLCHISDLISEHRSLFCHSRLGKPLTITSFQEISTIKRKLLSISLCIFFAQDILSQPHRQTKIPEFLPPSPRTTPQIRKSVSRLLFLTNEQENLYSAAYKTGYDLYGTTDN